MTSAINTQTLNEPLKAKERDPFYDNLRLFLMFSVVMCHMLSCVLSSTKHIRMVYEVLHAFTMPCFAMLTGFFSKGMAKAGSDKRLHIINTVLLYLIVQAIKMWIDGTTVAILLPQYGNWYLTAIVFWYAVLPAVNKFKPGVMLVASIIVSIIFVIDANRIAILQVHRTVAYFPFFLIGFYIDKAQAAVLKKAKVRIVGVILFTICVIVSVTLYQNKMMHLTAYGAYNYVSMNVTQLKAALYRLGWYAYAGIMCFGIMCVIPRKKTFLTVVGKRTMPIFIGHTILFDYLIERTNFFTWLYSYGSETGRLLLIIAIATVITFVLGNRWFAWVFDKFLGWDMRIFLKRTEQKKAWNTK